jgi:anti-sigma factor (TIGR02949 family)
VKIANEKVVGGLSCSEVLDRLSDYLDGDLSVEDRDKVEAHLRGCEGCARFGGEFSGTVTALRAHLVAGVTAPARIRERLREALGRE